MEFDNIVVMLSSCCLLPVRSDQLSQNMLAIVLERTAISVANLLLRVFTVCFYRGPEEVGMHMEYTDSGLLHDAT